MLVRRALTLAIVGPLLFAGCTGDPEPTPKIPDPDTSSPTPTPTDSETPDAESAEEFIRRWVEVSNEMQNSGEADEYFALSTRCGACKKVAERVSAAFNAGGFVETDGWTIRDMTDRSGGGARAIYDVRVDSAPTVIKESAEAKEQRLPGGTLTYRFRLTAGEPWGVVQLTQVPS